jgi:CRP-like cAMP-binding protein
VARHPTELAAANVAWSGVDAAAFLTGSLLAGVLAATAGLAVAFGACVVPLLAAALVARGLPADSRPPAAPGAVSEGRIRELNGGLRTVVKHPELRLVFAVFGADQLVQGMIDVLLVLAAIELLGLGEPGAGWLNGAWGVGGLAGGLAAVELLRRGRLGSGLMVGCVLAGLPLCLIAVVPVTGAALAAMVVLGVGFALAEVAVLTLVQRLAADDVLARVFGVELVLHLLGTGLGSVLAVVLVSVTGVAPALAITGALLPLLALLCRRRLAALRLGSTVSEEVFALVRGLAIFAPLPVATVETLAMRMHPEDRSAGSVVITQGQGGEDFFVVADGEVEVSIDGLAVRALGAGSFFGEISLLRDVPRTATVRALGDVRLLRLDREAFLAAIRAHPRSGQAAEGVVLERLAGAPAREPGLPVAPDAGRLSRPRGDQVVLARPLLHVAPLERGGHELREEVGRAGERRDARLASAAALARS